MWPPRALRPLVSGSVRAFADLGQAAVAVMVRGPTEVTMRLACKIRMDLIGVAALVGLGSTLVAAIRYDKTAF